MSRIIYRISYPSVEEKIRIRKEIERMRKQEEQRLERKRKILSKLEWIQEPLEELKLPLEIAESKTVPTDFTEIQIPSNLAREVGVSNESMFISTANDGLDLTILDFNLPEEKCENIASKFAQEIYKKAVGKEVSEESISIQPLARLKYPVCQHCFKPILDFTYKCNVCELDFCYSHRRPESHGCSQERELERNDFIKEFAGKERKSKRETKNPKIIIRKIPCG